ncbi:unnamed protein product [Phytophthora fragariaefolia]|uniref:Unnamed protein product n=1 Tax=Phytophthora fragariaefolia TaxID=1490495 RepID=A0A9W6XZX4_9STRA|nr:unnamed protein product [Phytophthora fragariaefolia]
MLTLIAGSRLLNPITPGNSSIHFQDTPPIPESAFTTPKQQQFNVALATMFYLCALPFAVVESQAFREPFGLLAPGIRFPSRHSLSGDLLRRVREQIRERAVALTSKYTTAEVCHDCDRFMDKREPLDDHKLYGRVSGHLGRVIDEVESETGSVVAGVLSDNASNMSAAWELLERTRPMFGGGCAAHMLNLLIQDVCQVDYFKAVQAKVLDITSYVRDHHAVLSQFVTTLRETSSSHRRALVVPVCTRWNSLHACFLRIYENKSVLKKLLTEPQFTALITRLASSKPAKLKLGRVKNSIGDSSFWRKLEQIIAFLDPMIEALLELESDNCPTSRVNTRFHWLLNHPAYGSDDAPSELKAAIKKFIDARWSHVHTYTDATGLAFLLDPHTNLDYFVGSDETDTITQGCDFAERRTLKEQILETGGTYSNKKDYPLVWEIAKRVLAIPPSSAASERAWSIMDFIHSKKRNRLTTDKVDMLAYIYVNHHAILKEGADWARLHSYPESCEALETDVTEQ